MSGREWVRVSVPWPAYCSVADRVRALAQELPPDGWYWTVFSVCEDEGLEEHARGWSMSGGEALAQAKEALDAAHGLSEERLRWALEKREVNWCSLCGRDDVDVTAIYECYGLSEAFSICRTCVALAQEVFDAYDSE